ncbi:MAG: S-methyl-5-thioribose-1-phosphate isomerase [Candidatus Sumerlaeota bacterium]|nr:S-methyl-5-thioribose-1-phosphate isomerase [Candidatus Sumerlaeota bacterium]
MPVETLSWRSGKLRIIDQTLLPARLKYIDLQTPEQVWEAIKKLRVRGAPAIGVAAAFGLYIGVKDSKARTGKELLGEVRRVAKYLGSSRPTAVNLFWALERLTRLAERRAEESPVRIKKALLDEARAMIDEDNAVCRAIGDAGQALLRSGQTVLTHCNAGGLATASYGTALAVVYRAVERGKKIAVFADETRPLLQGARLTTWELMQSNVPVTLICDNMAATVLSKGWVDAVIVGADRMASNGDFANKIGTYGLAILAKEHGVPFYAALPLSTIDMSLKSGAEIPIEERHPDEVAAPGGLRIAPRGCRVFNPAFDVTPAKYLAGIITEKGVIRRPFKANLKKLFDKA